MSNKKALRHMLSLLELEYRELHPQEITWFNTNLGYLLKRLKGKGGDIDPWAMEMEKWLNRGIKTAGDLRIIKQKMDFLTRVYGDKYLESLGRRLRWPDLPTFWQKVLSELTKHEQVEASRWGENLKVWLMEHHAENVQFKLTSSKTIQYQFTRGDWSLQMDVRLSKVLTEEKLAITLVARPPGAPTHKFMAEGTDLESVWQDMMGKIGQHLSPREKFVEVPQTLEEGMEEIK